MTLTSEIDLGREPLLREIPLPSGGVVARLWQGRTNAAGVGIELSQLRLAHPPTPTRLRQAWMARRAGNPRPVMVFTEADGRVLRNYSPGQVGVMVSSRA